MTPQIAQMGQRGRVSSDSAWPLRTATGETFAERTGPLPRRPCIQPRTMLPPSWLARLMGRG